MTVRLGAGWGAFAAALVVCLGGVCLGGASASARPLTPAEERNAPYSGIIPPCSDTSSLAEIQSHFSQRESEYWHSGLEIAGFEDVREIGFRSNGLDYIPRRYCQARVVMNNQQIRTVDYSIVEAGGSIGYTDAVVWCVVGLDRENGFSPACKMARP